MENTQGSQPAKQSDPGSPPHTWRIRKLAKLIDLNAGITSTYVENTKSDELLNYMPEDHLHIRGEYLALALNSSSVIGSPPHTWRILFAELRQNWATRITSTYVENTYHIYGSWCLQQDHLHIRGEYYSWSTNTHYRVGSPPHTWRIHYVELVPKVDAGITSTYVENTP